MSYYNYKIKKTIFKSYNKIINYLIIYCVAKIAEIFGILGLEYFNTDEDKK